MLDRLRVRKGWLLRAAALLLFLVVSACGSVLQWDDKLDEQSAGTGALANVTLSASRAPALGHVTVLGVPSNVRSGAVYAVFDGTDITLRTFSDTGTTVTPLIVRDGVYYLPVPMFDPEGSLATVIITDGSSRSETLALTIDPLPARRHGALDELIDAVTDLLSASTEALGLVFPDEWEHWRNSSLVGMPLAYLPLMEAWTVTLDEQNPESLVAAGLDGEALELAERILADGHLTATIHTAGSFVESNPSESPIDTQQSRIRRSPHPSKPAALSVAPLTARTLDNGSSVRVVRVPGDPVITTPERLAEELEKYRTVVRVERDVELADEIFLSHLSTLATLGAMKIAGPGGGVVVAGVYTSAMKGIVKAAKALGGAAGVARWFLPCCLADLVVEFDPPEGVIPEEDREPNQVRLTSARVTAESEGVNLARELVERFVAKAGGHIAENYFSPEFEAYLGETLAEVVGDLGVTDALQAFVGEQLADSTVIVFEWENIDVMGSEPQKWLSAQTTTLDGTGAPIIVQASTDRDRIEFALRAPQAFDRQDSVIRFSTNLDALPAPSVTRTALVNLEYVRVSFDITRLRLDAADFASGEPIEFPVRVHNTVERGDDLEASIDVWLDPEFPASAVGTVRVVPGSCAGDTCSVEYTPGSADDFPGEGVLVIAEFIGDGGIRGHHSAPPRRGVTSIVYERPAIEVEPASACVMSGTDFFFVARGVETGAPVSHEELVWSAGVGSITSGGRYTAPAEGVGTDTVQAALRVDPDVWARAEVVYGPCDGDSFFDLSGPLSGREMALETYFFDDGAPEIWILTLAGPRYLLQFESNRLRPVTGGIYQVNDSFDDGTFSAGLSSQDESDDMDEYFAQSGTISFTNVTPEFAVGSFDLTADDGLRIQGVFLAEPYEF